MGAAYHESTSCCRVEIWETQLNAGWRGPDRTSWSQQARFFPSRPLIGFCTKPFDSLDRSWSRPGRGGGLGRGRDAGEAPSLGDLIRILGCLPNYSLSSWSEDAEPCHGFPVDKSKNRGSWDSNHEPKSLAARSSWFKICVPRPHSWRPGQLSLRAFRRIHVTELECQ